MLGVGSRRDLRKKTAEFNIDIIPLIDHVRVFVRNQFLLVGVQLQCGLEISNRMAVRQGPLWRQMCKRMTFPVTLKV